MEDNLKKNGRRPQKNKLKKMEDNLKKNNGKEAKKKRKQAGAELCQAQFKLGLAKPAVAS